MRLLIECLMLLAICFYFSKRDAKNGLWRFHGYKMRRFANGA
jgi:hypothetical protein